MKRFFAIILTMTLVFALAACNNGNPSQEETTDTSPPSNDSSIPSENIEPTDTPDENDTNGNILIAYFSRTGNTETIANMIAEQTGGELFRVQTVIPYPEDYNETVDIAREEQDNDARPELSTHVEDMSRYDTIYLGYPNWWGTMPQAMFTFLEEYDFSGKTIIPFCTHGGSALGSSERDIANLVPDATLLDGLAVSGSRVDSAQDTVEDWLNGLDLE